MARDDRPRWRVNEPSFIGHNKVDVNDEVYYTPPTETSEVHENLSPLNDAAQAIVDAQKGDHPDKTKHAGKRAADAAAADAVEQEEEAERTDGLVGKGAARGSTKAAGAAKGGKGKAAPAKDAEEEELG